MVTLSESQIEARSGWPAQIVSLAVIAILFVAVAARILTFELRADEQLYISPAALMRTGAIYTDFFYNHTPFSAYFYRAVFLLTGAQDLVGAARLAMILAWGATLVCVWRASLAISRSLLMALFCVVAVETNVYLLTVVGMTATNNFLQVGLVYAGLAFFVLAVLEPRIRRLRMVGAGFVLAIAIGVKVSAAYAVLPLIVASMLVPGTLALRDRIRTLTVPLVLGGLIGLVPLAAFILADPTRFFDHVVGYHTGPHVAYWTAMQHTEPGLAFGLGARFRLAFEVWFQSTNLLVFAAVFFLGGLAASGAQRHGWGLFAGLVGISAVVAVLCFLPKPAFPQYFVLPLAGLVLMPPLLWRNLNADQKDIARPAVVGLILLIVLLGLPRLAEPVARLAVGMPTTAQRVQSAGAEIRDAMQAGPTGKVATLFPLYPLEADLPVYPEFATGPFAYRVVPMSAPDQLGSFVTIGPSEVGALFDSEPPAAILTGFLPDLEQPFEEWAKANGYRLDDQVAFRNRYGTARLWLPGE